MRKNKIIIETRSDTHALIIFISEYERWGREKKIFTFFASPYTFYFKNSV